MAKIVWSYFLSLTKGTLYILSNNKFPIPLVSISVPINFIFLKCFLIIEAIEKAISPWHPVIKNLIALFKIF